MKLFFFVTGGDKKTKFFALVGFLAGLLARLGAFTKSWVLHGAPLDQVLGLLANIRLNRK
jgi:hypothetical protein